MNHIRWINSLPILQRFFLEMVVGGVVILLVAMVSRLFWEVSQLFGIGVTAESIRVFFSVLNYPLICCWEFAFHAFGNGDYEKFGFTFIIPLMLTFLLYDSALFALFCEGIRFVVKWKKRSETPSEP